MEQNCLNYSILDHNQVSTEKWDSFVIQHQFSGVFHTSFMHKVFKSSPLHNPFAFFVIDNNGNCVAMLTGYIQTVMPGTFECFTKRVVMMQSPLFSDACALKALLTYYNGFFNNKIVYSEIRNHINSLNTHDIYKSFGFKYEDHLDIIVDLTQPPEVIFQNMNATRKKQIKRGYKRGSFVEIIPNDDTERIMQCVKIVQELYKRIHLPIPKKEIILTAALNCNEDVKFVCFALKNNEEIIGTRMVLCFKEIIFDWYAGSKEEHYDKYPNDILPWEVFKWGHINNYRIFDFGGAGKPGVKYGVRDYKLKFGGLLVNYGRFLKIHAPIKYFIAKNSFNTIKYFKSNPFSGLNCG